MDTFVDIVVGFMPSLLIAILTATITVRLSIKKFYTEQWWERKVNTYTDIFESLYSLKRYYDMRYESECNFEELSDVQLSELEIKRKDASIEIDKTIDIGSFILCDRAIKCLREYRSHPRLDYYKNPIFDLVAEESELLEKCIKELRIIALKELKVKNSI